MADKDDNEKTIAEDLVVTKYKMAGDIVNREYLKFVPRLDCPYGFEALGRAGVGAAAGPGRGPRCHVD